MRPDGFGSLENIWMASDFDGAFAQYVKVPATEIFAVDCDWSDAELATIPCAYATAETMLHRAHCHAGDKVLVTGASGGVGSAAVQLARRRGAHVTALTSASKSEALKALGADRVVTHDSDPIEALGADSIDLVIDNVAGDGFPTMLKLLRRGGRFTSSGAIAGPIVDLDMRDMYLKDISLIGTTAWDEPVFPDLISYIERGGDQTVAGRDLAAGRDRGGTGGVLEEDLYRQFRADPATCRRGNLTGDRDNQGKDQRGDDGHADIDLDQFFDHAKLRPEGGKARPDQEFAACDIEREPAHRQVELGGAQSREFRVEIPMRQQHRADQERIAELPGAAFESESWRSVMHFQNQAFGQF